MPNINELNNKFISDNRALVSRLSVTGDAARLAFRLTRATNHIEQLHNEIKELINSQQDSKEETAALLNLRALITQDVE